MEKIIWLRQHYHFGPAKIAMYLRRYHDVTISVWRILKRSGLNLLPASQRYQPRRPLDLDGPTPHRLTPS